MSTLGGNRKILQILYINKQDGIFFCIFILELISHSSYLITQLRGVLTFVWMTGIES